MERTMRTLTVDRTTSLGKLALRGIDIAEVVTRPLQHRGFMKLARWCGRLAPPGQRCTVDLAPDTRFIVETVDPYWSRLVSERFEYERGTGFALRHLSDIDYTFIDAGANFGYWSVLVTSRRYGAKPTVAIEPVTETFRALEENRRINGGRFATLQRALAEESGAPVVIRYPRTVVGARVSASCVGGERPAQDLGTETVESVSLDAVLGEFVPPHSPVIVKLDVEGMEVPALRGSRLLSERDWLVIYEDHGNDPTCATSDFVLGLDASVFFVTSQADVHPIGSLDDVRGFKHRTGIGYNFFAASRGGVFERRLAAATSLAA
jgi:FkbM family methyltransferase